jgi:hypothetical protein
MQIKQITEIICYNYFVNLKTRFTFAAALPECGLGEIKAIFETFP